MWRGGNIRLQSHRRRCRNRLKSSISRRNLAKSADAANESPSKPANVARAKSRDALQASGGEDGSRTRYLKVISLVLYPMSYFTAEESPMLLAEHTQQIPTSRDASCADSFISRVSFVLPHRAHTRRG